MADNEEKKAAPMPVLASVYAHTLLTMTPVTIQEFEELANHRGFDMDEHIADSLAEIAAVKNASESDKERHAYVVRSVQSADLSLTQKLAIIAMVVAKLECGERAV